ncbi:MAG: hypothetical protein PVH61_34280 [Candidatus Aminicenantes bacterium]|jgi:hypothetical protein
MLSVRGIYDGKQIKPLEEFDAPPNVEVIITFMDKRTTDQSIDDKTKELLELSGTWEDDRSVEEIIKEIYDSRTASQKGADL